jgi:hypothetical protein
LPVTCPLTRDWTDTRKCVGRAERRSPDSARQGYNALRHSAEFQTSLANSDEWVCRIWGEINLAGAGLALGTLSVTSDALKLSPITKDTTLRVVIDLLSQIHDLERLVPTAASRWTHSARSDKVRQGVEELLDRQNDVWAGRDPKKAFELRSWLLKRSSDLHK